MGDGLRYWEGTANFPVRVEVFMDGTRDDNMAQQREFFKRLCDDWSGVQERLSKVLEKERQKSAAKGTSSKDEKFEVSAISVPQGAFESAEWEISFATRLGCTLTVRMRECEPITRVVEG